MAHIHGRGTALQLLLCCVTLSPIPLPQLVRTVGGHSAGVVALSLAPDGRALYSCSRDKTVKRWELPTASEVRRGRVPRLPLARVL